MHSYPRSLLCVLTLVACSGDEQERTFEVVTVVKNLPDPPGGWWARWEEGVTLANERFDDVHARLEAPPIDGTQEESVAKQIEIIEGLIDEDVDALVVVPNDSLALDDALAQAQDAGILVLTHESPDQQSADWDVETIDSTRFGEQHIDRLAELSGSVGKYAIYVGGADLHNEWATAAITRQQNQYPSMELVTLSDELERMVLGEDDGLDDRTACGEVLEECQAATHQLLTAYPDLVGILAFGSQSPPGAGAALAELDDTDVYVVGVATPNSVKQLLTDGFVKQCYLWDPKDAAHASIAVAREILGGNRKLSGLDIEGLGTPGVNSQTKDVIFDKILGFDKDNVNDFDF